LNNKSSKLTTRLLLAGINLFESPWGAAIASGFIYISISAYSGSLFKQSLHPYYNYLADAFLHGQTWLRLTPSSIHDLSLVNGKYYLYWGPFPAILLMPLVAIFDVGLNDVIYTVVIAVINVGFIAQVLRSACNVDFLHLTKSQRAILVFFFAFGTVHITLASFGKVWMTGQLIGFLCTLLAYIAAFSLRGGKAWFFTGLALACAMLTRNHLVFTGIFPVVYLIFQEKSWKSVDLIRSLILGLLPLIIALTSYLLYNQVRFGNPLDTGVNYHNMAENFRNNFEEFGTFNIHYVITNFYYQYIFYPFFSSEIGMGGSLFLLSPLFFSVFYTLWKPRSKLYTSALVVSIIITNIPILLLMGTGWLQFGPRYTLDFSVPLLLLTALGIEKWPLRTSLLLAIISSLQYFIGVGILS